ncbi:MAG TPA: DUF3105 domain-containing protein [Ornithinimicrobium sp.]|uniref:DUF3105 domain-containing protein n=1 Tax=Ornithinimicrobium sp. TaxID=1977084 RepID=UPI002B471020|nr:DUF3105 domain-containing protein [Ornithinimicrobium sp.]HKJ12323.1 DUF3105 domain-containing protein [Ornithinimicrobium sp.]
MARRQPPTDRARRAAEMQRQARRAERRRSFLIWGGMSLVLLLIVGAIGYAVLSRPDLSAVKEYEDLGRDHVEAAVEYPQSPPAGGDHNQAWWTCGVYDDPIPAHHAVHSLEHGAVWLTYRPDISAEEREQLTELADQDFILLSPLEDQSSPVIATAWGKQLSVDSADDDRLPLFIDEFKQGPQTPEPGAACAGGTTTDLAQSP